MNFSAGAAIRFGWETFKRRPMAYSDNFKYNRVGPWTH